MKKFIVLAVFLLLSSLTFYAQSDSVITTLSEVIISANKTQTPYYTLASSVTVINSQDFFNRQLNSVVDILQEIPGLSVFQLGGPGMLANVNIRGANTNHTLVIIDGVEMNDAASPSNAFDFSTLNTNDIERIEIVRGPQSTLYGSDAVGGVISIFTKSGGINPHYSFFGEGGSNNYYRGNISASGNIGLLNYFVAATRSASDGISESDSKFGNNEKDGYTNNSVTSNLDFNFTKMLKLNLLYKFTKGNSDLDQNDKLGDDPNYTYKIEEQIFKGGLALNLFEGKWEQLLNASFIKRFSDAADNIDSSHPFLSSQNYTNAQRMKFEWQNNLSFLDYNLISFGLETETEKANTTYYSESEWGPYNSIFPKQSISTLGAYLQDQINISNTLYTSLGIRFDHNQKFGGVVTFRIAPAYYISSTQTRFKATVGTGFKAPSLFYLFDPMFGNPDLKPEKSTGWDFGFEQFLLNGKVKFGITYFNLDFKDMFAYDASFKEINIAKASSKGLEITASASGFYGLSINADYTYNKTKDEYNGTSDYDKPLLRRPTNRLVVNVNLQLDGNTNINLQSRYEGEREDKDFSTFPVQRVVLPSYTLMNLSASYKLFSYLTITGRIENLWDKKYEQVLYYGTLGRSFYAGLNFNL